MFCKSKIFCLEEGGGAIDPIWSFNIFPDKPRLQYNKSTRSRILSESRPVVPKL